MSAFPPFSDAFPPFLIATRDPLLVAHDRAYHRMHVAIAQISRAEGSARTHFTSRGMHWQSETVRLAELRCGESCR